MATEAQLIQGLQAADAAGNTADAQHFADQIKVLRTQSAPEAKPDGAPRWDILGDIGRDAKAAAGAVGEDLSAAFPNPGTMDLGPLATVKRMGHALRVPLDALGIPAALGIGTAHAIGGSAIAAGLDHMSIPGHDPKVDADQLIDQAMIGLAPSDPAAFAAAGPARAAARTARSEAKVTNKAAARVGARVKSDSLNPQDIVTAQQEALANGDQLNLIDLGGKNVRGLAGAVYRAPGAAGQAIDSALEARDTAASGALSKDIQGSVAKGSTYSATQDLLDARSKAGGPAFKEATSAESIAPFESQLRTALTQATGAKGQIAKQIADIEQKNPGALASRGAAGKATRDKYMELRQQLDQAETDRKATMDMFQKARADGSANAPGATWSPRLQEFLDHSEVQSGLKAGLKLEKQDAIAERRPFKDSDYSIVGTDEKGDPIVGAVPTMKSLAVAKEGLDAKIAEMRDPITGRPTKAGLSLKKFRDAFVNELDTLNPRYKAARDIWAGPSRSMEAIRDGRQHFSRTESNEQLKAEFDQLAPSEKDFYRMGAAEAKVDAVERAPDASDKSKRVINSERDRKRFRMLFDSDAQAQKFIDAVARKRKQFETKQSIKGGAQTAGRLADDANEEIPLALDAAHGLGQAATGNYLGLAHTALRLKHGLGLRNNPALNSEIARILLDPDLAASGQNAFARVPVPKVKNHLAAPATANSIAASQRSKN